MPLLQPHGDGLHATLYHIAVRSYLIAADRTSAENGEDTDSREKIEVAACHAGE